MISGFGRFISADEASKEMTDLRGYRCRIAVDSISEIPLTLSVVLGGEIFPIQVQVESWERSPPADGNDPPLPPPADPENFNDGNGLGRRHRDEGRGHAGGGELGPREAAEEEADQGGISELSVNCAAGGTRGAEGTRQLTSTLGGGDPRLPRTGGGLQLGGGEAPGSPRLVGGVGKLAPPPPTALPGRGGLAASRRGAAHPAVPRRAGGRHLDGVLPSRRCPCGDVEAI